MSATGRGAVRRDRDLYMTPRKAFDPMLPFIKDLKCPVWEPACGDGRLVNWMNEYDITADGSDIDRGIDYLSVNDPTYCIVTNPPFSLAFEFCKHAVSHSDHVFLLLRLNFLASRKRFDWFRKHEPSALFVLSERPSFTEDGHTDATDYAWFYWGPAYRGIFHV